MILKILGKLHTGVSLDHNSFIVMCLYSVINIIINIIIIIIIIIIFRSF